MTQEMFHIYLTCASCHHAVCGPQCIGLRQLSSVWRPEIWTQYSLRHQTP